jgi:ssDNA-binding Zn-finger/Zn-ribbon topoisomerase 1
MWPFKKKRAPVAMDPRQLSFSQTDVPRSVVDNLSLGPDDWIKTMPINALLPEARGLPPLDATEDQIYQVAERLSRLRESLRVSGKLSHKLSSDGVYCPICHIANTQLSILRKPCPRCGRDLLEFGWT